VSLAQRAQARVGQRVGVEAAAVTAGRNTITPCLSILSIANIHSSFVHSHCMIRRSLLFVTVLALAIVGCSAAGDSKSEKKKISLFASAELLHTSFVFPDPIIYPQPDLSLVSISVQPFLVLVCTKTDEQKSLQTTLDLVQRHPGLLSPRLVKGLSVKPLKIRLVRTLRTRSMM